MPSLCPAGALFTFYNLSNWDANTSMHSDSNVDSEKNDSNSETNSGDNESSCATTTTSHLKNLPPWMWPAWQQRTGVAGMIFSPAPTQHTPEQWSADGDCAAVWAFSMIYWNLSTANRVNYIRKKEDTNSKGHKLYLAWYKGIQSAWKLSDAIATIVSAEEASPFNHLRTLECDHVSVFLFRIHFLIVAKKIPPFDKSGINCAFVPLTKELFGSDGLVSGMRNKLKNPVWAYVYMVLLGYWQIQCNAVNRNDDTLEVLEDNIEACWQGESFPICVFVS